MKESSKWILATIVGVVGFTVYNIDQNSGNNNQKNQQVVSDHHGYVLKPRESVVLSYLIQDEISAFQDGRSTAFLGKNLVPVSAVEASKAYQENQVAADQKYYQKRLRLTGTIEGINSGLGNEPYVLLRGVNMFESPQVHFQQPNLEKVASLKKGEEIKLVCDGSGSLVGTPMFKNCIFLDDYTNQEIAKIKQQIEGFLAGEPQSDSIGIIPIMAITAARMLPETSPCFSDISYCKSEFNNFFKKDSDNQKFIPVINELESVGIQIPKAVIDKIESLRSKKVSNNAGK